MVLNCKFWVLYVAALLSAVCRLVADSEPLPLCSDCRTGPIRSYASRISGLERQSQAALNLGDISTYADKILSLEVEIGWNYGFENDTRRIAATFGARRRVGAGGRSSGPRTRSGARKTAVDLG